jgi:hypothetical protein
MANARDNAFLRRVQDVHRLTAALMPTNVGMDYGQLFIDLLLVNQLGDRSSVIDDWSRQLAQHA